jgi:glycosyltransferase involved in cell wall biosynthesis
MPKKVLFVEGNTDGTVGGSYFLMYDLVRRLDRTRYEPIVAFHTDNYLIAQLRAAGIEVLIFPRLQPFVFRWSLLNTVLAPFKKLINLYRGLIKSGFNEARFLRERRIDLVNLNNSITRNHSWMLAALLAKTPCVTHEMGINEEYSAMSRFFGKRLRRVISLSHAIHNAMRACGVDLPNITVIHCGIDLTRYHIVETPEQLRKKHGIPPESEVVGVVGNIRTWKGQVTMVRAAAILKQSYPNIRCILVGACGEADKEYGDMLAGLCRELGLENTVIFAGFQKNAIDYMELMDVVAHTSIHPEPFGIVTLEAMSRSKPLVSTTIGGPAEVVIDGSTGLLVEPGKPELLAGAIRRFLSDRTFAREAGQRGLQRLHADFSMEKNLSQTMQVYEDVFAASR